MPMPRLLQMVLGNRVHTVDPQLLNLGCTLIHDRRPCILNGVEVRGLFPNHLMSWICGLSLPGIGAIETHFF